MNGVIILREWRDALQALQPAERLSVYERIMAEAFDGGGEDLTGEAGMAWRFIAPALSRMTERYESTSRKRADAARERWKRQKAIAMPVDAPNGDCVTDRCDFDPSTRDIMRKWERHLLDMGVRVSVQTISAAYAEAEAAGCGTPDDLRKAVEFSAARGYKGIYRPIANGGRRTADGEELLTYAEYTKRAPTAPDGYYVAHPTAKAADGKALFYHPKNSKI